MKIALLVLGGGFGALCRYILAELFVIRAMNRVLPTAILTVNLLGSFGLGLFVGWVGVQSDSAITLVVGVGFFGAFTTFSTFSLETVGLMRKRKWGGVCLYLTTTIIGSTTLFFLGLSLLK